MYLWNCKSIKILQTLVEIVINMSLTIYSHHDHLLNRCCSVDKIHTPGFKVNILPTTQTYEMEYVYIVEHRGNFQSYNCVEGKTEVHTHHHSSHSWFWQNDTWVYRLDRNMVHSTITPFWATGGSDTHRANKWDLYSIVSQNPKQILS